MKHAAITLAIPFAILFAANAFAQNDRNPPTANPPQANPMQMPQTNPPPDLPPPRNTAGQQNQYPTGEQAGQPTPFDSLDRNHVGYLTREDARTDAWLAHNFDRCDVDHKARITRAEYDRCMHQPNR